MSKGAFLKRYRERNLEINSNSDHETPKEFGAIDQNVPSPPNTTQPINSTNPNFSLEAFMLSHLSASHTTNSGYLNPFSAAGNPAASMLRHLLTTTSNNYTTPTTSEQHHHQAAATTRTAVPPISPSLTPSPQPQLPPPHFQSIPSPPSSLASKSSESYWSAAEHTSNASLAHLYSTPPQTVPEDLTCKASRVKTEDVIEEEIEENDDDFRMGGLQIDGSNRRVSSGSCGTGNSGNLSESDTSFCSKDSASVPGGAHECQECGKTYSTSSNLARHRQTHRSLEDKKARKCPHCDKTYVSMPAFSMHIRTHNQGCKCPYCGKSFSRPWLLQGHIRTHTGEKPFKCNVCDKSFADKSNLRAHVQTHSNTKPYNCTRCNKAFALKSYLYKHEESSCMKFEIKQVKEDRRKKNGGSTSLPMSPEMHHAHSIDPVYPATSTSSISSPPPPAAPSVVVPSRPAMTHSSDLQDQQRAILLQALAAVASSQHAAAVASASKFEN